MTKETKGLVISCTMQVLDCCGYRNSVSVIPSLNVKAYIDPLFSSILLRFSFIKLK